MSQRKRSDFLYTRGLVGIFALSVGVVTFLVLKFTTLW